MQTLANPAHRMGERTSLGRTFSADPFVDALPLTVRTTSGRRSSSEDLADLRATEGKDGFHVLGDESAGDQPAKDAERQLVVHPIADHRPTSVRLELVGVLATMVRSSEGRTAGLERDDVALAFDS